MKASKQYHGIAVSIATLGPVGFLPFFPGTWGSAVGILIWWFLVPYANIFLYMSTLIALTAIAIPCSAVAEKKLGRDARPIVIDELVGQLLALVICPRTLFFALVGFGLFRIFDILKPFPLYRSQKLKSGLGVVIDDVLAGLYSLMVILVIRWVWFG